MVTNSAGSVTRRAGSVDRGRGDIHRPPDRYFDPGSKVGTGANLLIAGFVVGGTSENRPVLVRASGPAIGAAPFNVPGILPDPAIKLFGNGNPAPLIASNAGWLGNPQIAARSSRRGRFPAPDQPGEH